MGAIISPDLLAQMRHLLDIAGTDEHAATAAFNTLLERYDRDELAAAVLAITAEYVAATSSQG